jgi:hypothetical protein
VIGAKPAAVCRWICTLLGACPGDTLDDLFPDPERPAGPGPPSPTHPARRLAQADRSLTVAGDASDPGPSHLVPETCRGCPQAGPQRAARLRVRGDNTGGAAPCGGGPGAEPRGETDDRSNSFFII